MQVSESNWKTGEAWSWSSPSDEILATKHLRLPDDLPLGYHELTLQIAGESWRPSRLIVCPEPCL